MLSKTEIISDELDQIDQLVENKKYNEAVTALRSLLKTHPDSADVHVRLGNLLLHSQSRELAQKHLEEAIRLAPDDYHNWAHLANFHIRFKNEKAAIEVYEKALNYHKDNSNILFVLAGLYKRIENYDKSYEIIIKLLEKESDNIDYFMLYSELLQFIGKGDEAIDQYNSLVVSNEKKLPDMAYEKWYELMLAKERTKEAEETLSKLIAEEVKTPAIYHLYGQTLIQNHQYDKAYTIVAEALEHNPNYIPLLNTMALILRSTGKLDEAETYIERILEIEPFNAGATHQYATHGKAQYGNKYFNKVAFCGSKVTAMRDENKILTFYALGKIFDDVGDLPTAFEYFRQGGALYLKDKKTEVHLMQHMLTLYKDTFSKDIFEQNIGQGNPSKKPVFILGMPRSGTTLMEQVLSSIEGVTGVGELTYMRTAVEGMKVNDTIFSSMSKGSPFYGKENVTIHERIDFYMENLESLAPQDAKRIVDKMPANFAWLGLILLLFPNAHILHSRRHPVEVCLSAYRILFAGGQTWSYDLKEMGKYYRIYWEMMKFWEEVLPEGSILDVFYENMVEDLEYESKRLAEFIDMPWNEKCLAFHKSDKVVKTASITQVRKPIYKTSVNRWQKYAPYLQPLIEEISDLIDEYEIELTESKKEKNTAS